MLAKKPLADELFRLDLNAHGMNNGSTIKRSSEEIKYDQLTDDIESLEEQRSMVKVRHKAAAILVGSPNVDDIEEGLQEGDLPDVDFIYKLKISNPYETCFALLYLLDSGSPLPWLAPLGVMVLGAAAKLLPWHKFDAYIDEEFDEEYADEDVDNEESTGESEEDMIDPECNDVSLDNLTPIDWIEEEAKLYRPFINIPSLMQKVKTMRQTKKRCSIIPNLFTGSLELLYQEMFLSLKIWQRYICLLALMRRRHCSLKSM